MTEIPLREHARGRWRSLLPALGIDGRYLDGKHGPCPICKGGRDRFRFDDKDGYGTWICSVCGAGDGFSLVMKAKGWDFKELAAEIEPLIGKAPRNLPPRQKRNDAALREAMNNLWKAAVPLSAGDPVATYLANRAIRLPAWPPALRYVERCRYQGDKAEWFPAMLAKVAGADGKPATIHRTYLTANGKKAPVESPRRLMPGKLPKGCAVRLAKPGKALGIAEGIETALAASIIWNVPCWAAVSAQMLMEWSPPDGVEEVIVFGDNDKSFTGQAAAYSLAYRLSVKDRLKVRVELPPDEGADWNDALMADEMDEAA